MGKFSDLPFFLLDEYFSESISTSNDTITPISGSYLHGGRSSIIVDGGYWEKMWINVKTINSEEPEYPGLVAYNFKINSSYRNGDNFNFDLGSLITLQASANGTFENESEVYFKKGSYIYEWLTKNSEYKDYFNTNKTWLYFGKIYLHSSSTSTYRIIFDGLKNFALNCLPLHQRTDNIQEFLKLYFDNIQHKTYNMTKDISTLIDPMEVDSNWIYYVAKNYNMDTDIGFSGLQLREWVECLPNLLKRRGTYTSLYIIWKLFLKNTPDNLNIYNRWHNRNLYSTYGIRTPLGHFYDVLHQMSYGYRPEGCAGKKWYMKIFDDVATHDIYHQSNEALIWKTRHQMYTKNIVVQCYDLSYNRIWPTKVEAINTGLVEVTFSTPQAGYVFMESDEDYLHSQNDESIEWSISHNQDQKEVITQYQTLLYNMMMPETIDISDANITSVNFSSAVDGYGIILKDGVYAYNFKTTPLSEWSINHALGKRELLVQTFDVNDLMTQANNIHLDDENNCTITWSKPTSGYAILKTVEHETSLPNWTDKVLSTHYKVEIDLSCAPLNDDDTIPKILSESTIDSLIEKWESMRPVTRVSHYHELISPITDFTGAYYPLYSGYNSFLLTKYCASSSEYVPAASASEMVYNQYSNSNKWVVTHNFGTRNLIVQCYDRSNNRIWPKSILGRYNNQIDIEFDKSVNGTAAVLSTAVSGYLYTENSSAGSSPWLINHALNLKEVISQYDNTSYRKIMPSDVELSDSNNLIATWSSYKNGMGLISASEVIWLETVPTSVWYIDHRLGCDSVICLFFDDNDKMIQPEYINLASNNRVVARFSDDTSGYAIVRSVNKAFLESDVMDNISYWMLGCGVSGSSFDPVVNNSVDTFLVSGSDFEYYYDNDYYYLDMEIGKQDDDMNITEIAWFDKYNKIRFYTCCSIIHKPKDVWFNSHHRIKRSQL
jgi:hypothetical protein